MLATSISILALWVPFGYYHSHAGLIVFASVYGFNSGAFVSLLMPCAAKSGSIDNLGQVFGTFQTFVSISYVSSQPSSFDVTHKVRCLTGLPIMGAILSRQSNESFLGLQLFGACSIMMGAVFMGVSAFIYGRRMTQDRSGKGLAT